MKKHTVRLTQEAAFRLGDTFKIKQVAIEAAEKAGDREVKFLTFTHGGKQYALSTRTIIEVDWFPHRVPKKVIRNR